VIKHISSVLAKEIILIFEADKGYDAEALRASS
jgi:hypothetical protein